MAATSVSADSLALNPGKGPNEETLKAILERSGYTLDVTTGQRKYGGPPPNWEGPAPGPGCEVSTFTPCKKAGFGYGPAHPFETCSGSQSLFISF